MTRSPSAIPPRATDGNLRKWNELLSYADAGLADNVSYQRIQGNNPDGSRNPDLEPLLDVDNFIDYIVAGQFDAADDWPCNFYAVRRRGADSQGFQFITWDNDLALPAIVNQQGIAVPDVNASRVDIDTSGAYATSPWRLEAALPESGLPYALCRRGAASPAGRWRLDTAEEHRPLDAVGRTGRTRPGRRIRSLGRLPPRRGPVG